MPFTYTISCDRSGCSQAAKYKVASRWTDGQTQELKTFALVCEDCLPGAFHLSIEAHQDCRLGKRETLSSPSVFEMTREEDRLQLHRREDLEAELHV